MNVREKGAAMVEGALVMLSLLAMLLFIMDMGRILLMEQYIAYRAEATVRQAAVNNWTSADAQNYLVYNDTSGSGPGLMGLTASEVSYTTVGTSGAPDYMVQVTVSGVPAFEWIPFIAGRLALPSVVVTAPAQSLGTAN